MLLRPRALAHTCATISLNQRWISENGYDVLTIYFREEGEFGVKIDPTKLDRKGAHDLLCGAALPRPIAFVSTVGEKGIYNLAPFSFFIPMSVIPAIVGLGIGRRADGS